MQVLFNYLRCSKISFRFYYIKAENSQNKSKKVSIKQNKPLFYYRKNALDIILGKPIYILEYI